MTLLQLVSHPATHSRPPDGALPPPRGSAQVPQGLCTQGEWGARCSKPPAAPCPEEEHPHPQGPKATLSLPPASGKAGATSCPRQLPPLPKGFEARMRLAAFLSARRQFPSHYLSPGTGGCCQVDAVFPGPKTTHLPAKPPRHISSSLQDVKLCQNFPAPSLQLGAAPVESQPGTTRDARQRLLPARRAKPGGFAACPAARAGIALPDVAARCANPPPWPFFISGAAFWLRGDGKRREAVGK